MTRSILILASVVVLLGGCASTVKKSDESAPVPVGVKATGKAVVLNMTGSTVATTAKDWTDFKGVWREKCAEEICHRGGPVLDAGGRAAADRCGRNSGRGQRRGLSLHLGGRTHHVRRADG